jgi:predicted transcriptional regulator
MNELKEVISFHIQYLVKNNDFLLVEDDRAEEMMTKKEREKLSEIIGIPVSSLYNVLNGTAKIDSMMKVIKVLDKGLYDKFLVLIKSNKNG